MKKIICIGLALLVFTHTRAQQKLTSYVNPFIGTQDMGHLYPGASLPFGMVQLSPDTDTIPYSIGKGYIPEVYRYCAGYQYNDKTIVGFSHTHFSGTGHSDLGDFLIMPSQGKLQLNPGIASNPASGYRSAFSHSSEVASPGYYSVTLSDQNIKAELSCTDRVGYHRYTFSASDSAHIILDMVAGIYNYDGKVVWSSIRVENDSVVTGYRQTRGWGRDRLLHFAMVFSKKIKHYGYRNDEKLVYRDWYRKWKQDENFPEMAGKNVRAFFDFDVDAGDVIEIKFALSPVSTSNALLNLTTEIPHWNFYRTKQQAGDKWEQELSRIKVQGNTDQKTNFYTALYRSFLGTTLFCDVNGEYRGLDQNIHRTAGANYSTFSLWDTYRALHPLYTIVQQNRTIDIVNSMLAHYQQSVHHLLPVWSHQGNENWCMIGYHAVPVIADAYLKGLRGFDTTLALQACLVTATHSTYEGLGEYMRLGYVPVDGNSNSASKTLEYAFDDWCIYRMAASMNKPEISRAYIKRARSFENIADKNSRFMRARHADGNWQSPFDPLQTEGQGYIEGNGWNYSLYVPHDPEWLIDFYGGNKSFVSHLDSLFSMKLDAKYFAHTEDINAVGLMGNYTHGNEPSHHVPYLYSYAGAPWKTQEMIHAIVNRMYRNKPDGLCGNDDCGQMSAWFVFSSLGFYPVSPGSNEYVIGSPCLAAADIHLENGRIFSVKTKGLSDKNIYIRSMKLNGKPYDRLYITHADIMAGGVLEFEMSGSPGPSSKAAKPYSMGREH